MGYRCGVCAGATEPGEPLRKHIITRAVPGCGYDDNGDARIRTEIEKEVPLCHSCDKLIKDGAPFEALVRQRGKVFTPKPVLSNVAVPGKILTAWPMKR